ncbi:hypothetical protein [uncultured Thiohalocapsa sp.]|uniref:NACHT domain-containing protein n=1 Tax=uncultured Thiohalocapsa sp. TaxID=768990 RepID=UPI0025E5F634|nr:hypothetical protein [uncultured Thiohalocapsa sp.]
MTVKVLMVHAEGEADQAEILTKPLRAEGYEPVHQETVLVGDSFTEQASLLLATNGPLVLCGTIKAAGTGLPYRLLNAKRAQKGRVQIFPVLMETGAYLDVLAQNARIADYAANPAQAVADLLAALKARWPLDAEARESQARLDLEARYRQLALKSHDIVDLANLPEDDRHLATQELELRRLYVPLRLRLEVQTGDEPSDETLAALEQRRRPRWGDAEPDRPPRQYEQGAVAPIGERLGSAQQLVVLGDPGAGKSTLLRWLATAYLLRLQRDPDLRDLPDVQSLPDADWLPILIRCRDLPPGLPPGSETLDAMLDHSLRKAELPESDCTPLRELLRTKLQQGAALLLIDGLDEITDPRDRARFAEHLTHIQHAIDQAPMVVTSRIVGYREMGYRIRAGFEHLTVADLTTEDKVHFAVRWCALTEHPERRVDAAAELIRDIHSTDRIERLTGNPMLLTTMALIKRKLGRLPQRRVDLYEKAVEVLLNWRSQVDQPIDPREALPQLEYLAHAMCADGIQQVREDQVLTWLRRCRDEFPQIHPLREHSPEAFLALLERRTGLLIQAGLTRYDGRTVPVYEFRHLTLQEYLAAIALVQGHYRDRDRSKGLAEVVGALAGQTVEQDAPYRGAETQETAVVESWREPLRLCLTACNDDEADAALRAILRPAPGEIKTERPRTVMAALW